VTWLKFQDQLEKIHRVTIPRQVTIHKSVTLQVYGFADASERAYRACIYLRSTDSQNRHWSHLLCSKSRVAPLEIQSLPRWELCAAVLVIKLFNHQGLKPPPHIFKTFVVNKVTEILQGNNVTLWRHIPSKDDAADILPRGLDLEDLVHHKIWYHGPHWLNQVETTWPADDLQPIQVPEKRKLTTLRTNISTEGQILERLSSLPLLKRIIAYCLRLYNNTRQQSKGR
jgi:hypothetical protein